MAEQSLHDVVAIQRSADASASVDGPVNHIFDISAPAADASLPSDDLHLSNTELDGDTSTLEVPDSKEEAILQGQGGEGSGTGSDVETRDSENVETSGKEDDKIRRYSVKKPASFKPVSFTKSFLAKAGSATPTKVIPEKTTAANLPASVPSQARPRLVAKAASGHRSSVPKSLNGGSKNGRSTGPDPNQVWNRNRVQTPQATPKHLTDEELRQQYGIQLASRPLDDGDSKEAKWADIDDEEDDWAPETLEWSDGTKISLAQIEQNKAAAAAAAAQEEAEAQATKEKELQAAKLKAEAPKPTTIIGPNATVLKLGAAAAQSKANGSSPKPSMDKPTLVARPSTSTPKSPWAPIPLVDKVAPLQINPPVQNQASKFAQRDVHGFDTMPPPPIQAKEIEADDFSRMPRDPSISAPSQLYNSQSGRYEPVPENRRNSVRKDGNFRQPSVLQRPSNLDQHAPAEPSPAFQTQRMQSENTPWTRKRGSSNVSADNLSFARRMSTNNRDGPKSASDFINRHQTQRDSDIGTPGIEHARPLPHEISPALSHALSMSSQSPITSSVQIAVPVEGGTDIVQPVAPPTQQDTIAEQKRVMRESREAAIRRRREEEANEEAARRERIKVKLEQLEKDAKVKEAKKDEEEAKLTKSPTETTMDRIPPDVDKVVRQPHATKALSPPKPPVVSATGPPQQYGMMKVHPSQSPITKSSVPTQLLEQQKQERAQNSRDVTPPQPLKEQVLAPNEPQSHVQHPQSKNDSIRPQINGTVSDQSRLLDGTSSVARGPDVTEEQKQATWNAISQARSSALGPWGNTQSGSSTPIGGNLWGPPANRPAIGNGDFQVSAHRNQIPSSSRSPFSQHLMVSQNATPHPQQPIPPIRAGQPGHHGGVSSRQFDVREEFRSISPFSHNDLPRRPSSQGFVQMPPSSNATTHRSPPAQTTPATGLAAWLAFSDNPAQYDAEKMAQVQAEQASNLAMDRSAHQRQVQGLPVFKETWKQVKVGGELGSRQVIGQLESRNNMQADRTSSTLQDGLDHEIQPPAAQARSRYQDFFDHNERVNNVATSSRPLSPSNPPPEALDHPVFGGMSHKPMVHLPGSKLTQPDLLDGLSSEDMAGKPVLPEGLDVPTKPLVKLPPPTALNSTPLATHLSMPSLRPQSQAVVHNPTWQARFNGLFGRQSSPAKPLAAHTSSREPMDPVASPHSAAVTLPPQKTSRAFLATYLEKNFEDEDALFEERDFGSVPTVNLADPRLFEDKELSSTPTTHPSIFGETTTLSRELFFAGMEDRSAHGGLAVIILLQGMKAPTKKTLSRPSSHVQSSVHRPRYQNGHGRGGKPRNHLPRPREPSGQNKKSQPAKHTDRPAQSNGAIARGSGTVNRSWGPRMPGHA